MDLIELAQIIPKPVSQWQHADLQLWLTYIRCPQLQSRFKQMGITGRELVKMDGSYLNDVMEIKSRILIKKLTNWICYLVKNEQLFMGMAKTKIKERSVNLTRITPEVNQEENVYEWEDNAETGSMTSEITELTQRRNELVSERSSVLSLSNHTPLSIYQRFGKENKFYICAGRDITMGRSCDNDIYCAESGIELSHCGIVHREGEHYLKPEANCEVWLKITSKLRLSRIYIIEMGEVTLQVTAENQVLQLRVIKGGRAERGFSFNGQTTDKIRVGRKIGCELSFQHDLTMSSFHGKFIFEGGEWFFLDLQTTNGSWWRTGGEQLISNGLTFRLGLSDASYECELGEEGGSVSSGSEMETCRKCSSQDKNSYMRPCYHNYLCYECGLTAKKCGLCQSEVTQVVRIFRE